MSDLIDHIRRGAADQVRLFFSPFRGAIDAIKAELHRPAAPVQQMDIGLAEHVRQLVKEDVRLYFVPFSGAIDGIKAELRRRKPHEKHVSAKQEKGSCL